MRPLIVWILWAGCAEDKTAVDSGAPSTDLLCPTSFSYETRSEPDAVRVAGTFNDWATDDIEMTEVLDGLWSVEVWLPPGNYPYKMVEYTEWTHDGAELWTCDPGAPLIHCEVPNSDTNWTQDCRTGADTCNSMVVVPDCTVPSLAVERVQIDRETGGLQVTLRGTPSVSGEPIETVSASINNAPVAAVAQDGVFHVELSGLSPHRHTLRAVATDAAGEQSVAVVVPAWLDDWSWDEAVLYHALIDRVANGSTANDRAEGTTHPITDFAGGDLQGLTEALPYLDSLGVNAIWVSNPQPQPAGAWAGDCGATYSGYHGFWPSDWTGIDDHLGTEADWKTFIDAAHARNMRVVMDWVGNQVHEDHPLTREWEEESFNARALCNEADRYGTLGWDRIPESCWFADYLPDLNQAQPDVLVADIESAIQWAQDHDLDGLRVDAAKHMPHAVSWNLSSRVAQSLEHRDAGSDFEFYLVGETFDGQDRINAYIGDNQLDGQFDFPLYWTLREALIYDSVSLADLVNTGSTLAERYPGGRMSTFLGNLDVGRFSTNAAEWTEEECVEGGIRQAGTPTDPNVYDRLVLAWTFLFTQPGIPLIYYGDELGLPGYNDPDNRQPLWWTADITAGEVSDVQTQLPGGPAWVLGTVADLAQARADHPALATGQTTEWWAEPSDWPTLYAYARTQGDDAALVILSRWTDEATITNGLSYAGLPTNVVYEDVLTGETFEAQGDSLTVTVPAMHARVLIPR